MCPVLLFSCSITGNFEVLGVALGKWKGMIMGIHPITASQDVNAACLPLLAQRFTKGTHVYKCKKLLASPHGEFTRM